MNGLVIAAVVTYLVLFVLILLEGRLRPTRSSWCLTLIYATAWPLIFAVGCLVSFIEAGS